jgi:hypothetical protein
MSHTLVDVNKARYLAEAVPLLAGGYLAIFRVHLRGRPEAEDDMFFGNEHRTAVAAMHEASSMAEQYLRMHGDEW